MGLERGTRDQAAIGIIIPGVRALKGPRIEGRDSVRTLSRLRDWSDLELRNDLKCILSGLAFLHTEIRCNCALKSTWTLKERKRSYSRRTESQGLDTAAGKPALWKMMPSRCPKSSQQPNRSQRTLERPYLLFNISTWKTAYKALRVFKRKQFAFFFLDRLQGMHQQDNDGERV